MYSATYMRFQNSDQDCWEKIGDCLLTPLHKGMGHSEWNFLWDEQTQRVAEVAWAVFALTLWIVPTLIGLAMYRISTTHDLSHHSATMIYNAQLRIKREDAASSSSASTTPSTVTAGGDRKTAIARNPLPSHGDDKGPAQSALKGDTKDPAPSKPKEEESDLKVRTETQPTNDSEETTASSKPKPKVGSDAAAGTKSELKSDVKLADKNTSDVKAPTADKPKEEVESDLKQVAESTPPPPAPSKPAVEATAPKPTEVVPPKPTYEKQHADCARMIMMISTEKDEKGEKWLSAPARVKLREDLAQLISSMPEAEVERYVETLNGSINEPGGNGFPKVFELVTKEVVEFCYRYYLKEENIEKLILRLTNRNAYGCVDRDLFTRLQQNQKHFKAVMERCFQSSHSNVVSLISGVWKEYKAMLNLLLTIPGITIDKFSDTIRPNTNFFCYQVLKDLSQLKATVSLDRTIDLEKYLSVFTIYEHREQRAIKDSAARKEVIVRLRDTMIAEGCTSPEFNCIRFSLNALPDGYILKPAFGS